MCLEDGVITGLEVVRGAPCGATWEAARKIVGMGAQEAIERIGLETQFFCIADPSSWDPLWGKSPIHFAADVHTKALKKALSRKRRGLQSD